MLNQPNSFPVGVQEQREGSDSTSQLATSTRNEIHNLAQLNELLSTPPVSILSNQLLQQHSYIPLSSEQVRSSERPLLALGTLVEIGRGTFPTTFAQLCLTGEGLAIRVQTSFIEGKERFRDEPTFRPIKKSDFDFFRTTPAQLAATVLAVCSSYRPDGENNR